MANDHKRCAFNYRHKPISDAAIKRILKKAGWKEVDDGDWTHPRRKVKSIEGTPIDSYGMDAAFQEVIENEIARFIKEQGKMQKALKAKR